MSETPPGSRFVIYDDDENQFVAKAYRDLATALADAEQWAREDGRCASYTVYEKHATFAWAEGGEAK